MVVKEEVVSEEEDDLQKELKELLPKEEIKEEVVLEEEAEGVDSVEEIEEESKYGI